MSKNEKGLQAVAQETADLIVRIRDGLEKLNREKLEPTAVMLEAVAASTDTKPKPSVN